MASTALLAPLMRPLISCKSCLHSSATTSGALHGAAELAARSVPLQAQAHTRRARFDLGDRDASMLQSAAPQVSGPPSAAYDPEAQQVDHPAEHRRPRTAPFVPPSVDKLINIMMRHGQKDTARRIVFDTSHALYNMTRRPNPRPELKQRSARFVKH